MDGGDDGGHASLRRVWPDGVPPEEDALLNAMPPARAGLVLRRLRAILDVDDGRPVRDVAGELGIDTPAFYRMRKRWRMDPSLRSIAPFAGRAPRTLGTTSKRPDPSLVEAVLRDAAPDASATQLARDLLARWDRPLSLDAAVRLVRTEHMRLTGDAAYVAGKFGRSLLVDVCAVSLGVDVHGVVVPAVVGVVMERASRLILGHGAELATSSLTAQSEAAWSIGRLVGFGGSGSDDPKLELVVGYGDDALAIGIARRAARENVSVVTSGDRRCGVRMLSLVGHRLGRLRLRPRATLPAASWPPGGSDLSHPPMSEAHATALIDEAVRDHNAGRLALLTGDCGTASRGKDAAAEYIRAILDVSADGVGVDMLVRGCRTIGHLFDERG